MAPQLNDITPALQDYLEAVLRLEQETDSARISDIASSIGVGKPAVTSAMKTLAQRELVNYEAYHTVTLTAKGSRLASEIQRRHRVIRQFLTEILGLDHSRADANACRMEHAVDAVVLDRLAELTEHIQQDPAVSSRFIESFHRHLAQQESPEQKGPK
jgi:DtxR family Mn-dependent transcriptional regulator